MVQRTRQVFLLTCQKCYIIHSWYHDDAEGGIQMEDRKSFTMRISTTLYDKLVQSARDNKRSMAKELEFAVAYYLEEQGNNPTVFGQRLKGLRESMGKSRAELGQGLNMPESDISKYERGVLEPDPKTLVKIAIHFGMSIDYLLGVTDERNLTIPDIEKLKEMIPEWNEMLSEENRAKIENMELFYRVFKNVTIHEAPDDEGKE